jgi:hypothetical protein
MAVAPPLPSERSEWSFSESAFWTADPKFLSQDWIDFCHGVILGAGVTTLFILSALLYLPVAYLCALVVNKRRGKKPAKEESRFKFHMKNGGLLSGLATWMLFLSIHLWQTIVFAYHGHQVYLLVLVRATVVATILHMGLTVLFIVGYSVCKKLKPAKGTTDIELQERSVHVESFQRRDRRSSAFTAGSVETLPPYPGRSRASEESVSTASKKQEPIADNGN